jgi:hypothetical protein
MDSMVHHLQEKGNRPFLDVPLKKKNSTLKLSHLSTTIPPLPSQNEKEVEVNDSQVEPHTRLAPDPLWQYLC